MQDSTYPAFLNLGVLSCVDFSMSILKLAHFFQWNFLGFWTTKTSKSAHSPWLHLEKSFANFSFLRIWHSRSSLAVNDEFMMEPKDLSTISILITDFHAIVCPPLFSLRFVWCDSHFCIRTQPSNVEGRRRIGLAFPMVPGALAFPWLILSVLQNSHAD